MAMADLDDTLPTEDQAFLTALRDAVRAEAHRVVAWAGRSDAGAVRPRNEDAWGQHEDRAFVVADGMGGHEGGTLASRTAVAAFLEAVRDRPTRWQDAVATINATVREAAAAAGADRAGTTLVAMVVDGQQATVVNVGDSRVLRWRDGHVERLTEDHTVRSEMLAAGIDAERERARGVRVGGLTSFVGAAPDRLRVDVVGVDLANGDRFLLCTDGVHRQVGDADLRAALEADTCEEAAARLLRCAAQAGGRDNATAVVLDIGGVAPHADYDDVALVQEDEA